MSDTTDYRRSVVGIVESDHTENTNDKVAVG